MMCWLVQRLRQKQLGAAEDVRQVWSALSTVLEELGQSADQGSPGSSDLENCARNSQAADQTPDIGAAAQSRLDAVCDVVGEWGSSLVCSDLESLQYLLSRLEAASFQWPLLSGRLNGLSRALQEAVQHMYGGWIACL